MGYNGLVNAGFGAGRALRGLYDTFQRLRGGIPYPRRRGRIPAGAKTPNSTLNLQPGELVRVKSYEDILATLDVNNKNRGLYFDAEMVPYCGRSFRVLKRVSKILDEKTGKMMEFKNPCIILEGVVCQSRYSECRLFCPRSIYSYWREIWLERISEINPKASNQPAGKSADDRAFEPSGQAVCATHDGRDQFSRLRDSGAVDRKPECASCIRLACTRTELALPVHWEARRN